MSNNLPVDNTTARLTSWDLRDIGRDCLSPSVGVREAGMGGWWKFEDKKRKRASLCHCLLYSSGRGG